MDVTDEELNYSDLWKEMLFFKACMWSLLLRPSNLKCNAGSDKHDSNKSVGRKGASFCHT